MENLTSLIASEVSTPQISAIKINEYGNKVAKIAELKKELKNLEDQVSRDESKFLVALKAGAKLVTTTFSLLLGSKSGRTTTAYQKIIQGLEKDGKLNSTQVTLLRSLEKQHTKPAVSKSCVLVEDVKVGAVIK